MCPGAFHPYFIPNRSLDFHSYFVLLPSSCTLLFLDVARYIFDKAGYKMTAAVRKKDEELTINLKCIIGVLMTDSGLCLDGARHRAIPHRAHAVYIYPSQRSMSFMLATIISSMSIAMPTYSARIMNVSLGLRRVTIS